jgi:hypothetical protein
MSAFLIIACIGAALIALAIGIAHNTSLGGTRSDYNDGSSFVAGLGLALIVIGLVGAVAKAVVP